jgi:3-methyladenine DNA glycosylase Tag
MRPLRFFVTLAALAAWGAAGERPEAETQREQFRKAMQEFERSVAYRAQRDAMERALSEAQHREKQAAFREAIQEAQRSAELQKQRFDFEWLLEQAARSFERLAHENRLRQEVEKAVHRRAAAGEFERALPDQPRR